MSTDFTQLVDEFAAIYDPLVDLQEQVAQAIEADVEYPLWSFSGGREKVANFVVSLDYEDDDNANSTKTLPALVALPAEYCRLIHLINEKRTALATLLKEMDKESTFEGVKRSKYLLAKLQLRRLNRRALLRHYVELNDAPDSVRYMWAQTRSVRKMTAEKAVKSVAALIMDVSTTEMKQALLAEHSKLSGLNPGEIVARVNVNAPQPRANMVINGKRVLGKTAMMPIFYPWKKGDPIPKLIPLTESKPDSERLKRSDEIIEEVAFTPISKFHRYKQPHNKKD